MLGIASNSSGGVPSPQSGAPQRSPQRRRAPAPPRAAPPHTPPQQERNQQRAERPFPRDVAQDAERHAGFLAFLDRAADAIGGAPDGVGNFFDRRLGFWIGIQAFIHKRWGGHVVGHGRTS